MESSPSTLVIRADAGVQIGTGHVMRCLALAQSWQDAGGRVTFALADPPASIEARLRAESCQIERVTATPGSRADADEVAALAGRMGAEWLVLDGYHFDGAYQRRIKDCGLQLVAVDDCGHATNYAADVVINQNMHASEGLYPRREAYTRLLLGTRYALLRREFLTWRDWRRTIPDVARKVLITLGGSDPDNITMRVLHALEQVGGDELEVVVLVGGSNPHLSALQTAADSLAKNIRLLANETNVARWMAWADAAVTAGGSSVWELALLGVPALGLGRAHQETELLRGAAAQGMIVDLGFYGNITPGAIGKRLSQLLQDAGERARLSAATRNRIDGRGPERVLQAMGKEQHELARA